MFHILLVVWFLLSCPQFLSIASASEQGQVSSVCWLTVCTTVTCAPRSIVLTNTWGTGHSCEDCEPADTGQLCMAGTSTSEIIL